jgi:hypothetical protein
MNVADTKLLRQFLDLAGKRLSGEWVVIGGALLPLLGVSQRVTMDIDIAGPPDATNADTLTLFEIARDIGLPIEAINQSASFFLHRVDGYEKMLVVLHEGPSATILRPNLTLYVLLKLNRMSETDLEDCMALLARAPALEETPDARLLLAEVEKRMDEPTCPVERRKRCSALAERLKESLVKESLV